MTIASEIAKLISNLADCYTACTNKGATIPQDENFDNLATCIDSIPAGGSTGNVKEFLVRVIDYDGTVIKDEYLDIGETFTLPTPPTHSGLVFQSWSCPVNIVDNTVTVDGNDIIIGATYTTASGHNEIEIRLDSGTGLEVSLTFSSAATVTGLVDWGDGTSETISGSSATHTYANYGKYIISNDFTPANPYITSTSTTYSVVDGIRLAVSGSYALDVGTSSAIKYLIMAEGTELASSSVCVPQVIIPSGTTTTSFVLIGSSMRYQLNYLVIPNSVTRIDGNPKGSYNLNYLCLPSNAGARLYSQQTFLETIPIKHFISQAYETYQMAQEPYTINLNILIRNCYTIKRLGFPDTITKITGGSSNNGAYALEYIKYPSALNQLDYLYKTMRNGTVYDFTACNSIPTLSNVQQLAVGSKILVPSALKSAWEIETNWSAYAGYIIGV